MKNFFISIKNNKKLMNWLIMSVLTVIISCSLILNIIYLPKYFNSSNSSNGSLTDLTEIKIDAVIGKPNNSQDTIVLSPIKYITSLSNLGAIITSDSNNYQWSKSIYGNFLTAVKSDQSNNWVHPGSKESWIINYWNSSINEYDPTAVGMDLLPLHNNDVYRLSLESWA